MLWWLELCLLSLQDKETSNNVFWFSVCLGWFWAAQFLILIVVFLFSWRISVGPLALNLLAHVCILVLETFGCVLVF